MSKKDLLGFIKGLDKVSQAFIEINSKECSKVWQNSSVRTAAKQVVEEAGSKTVNMSPGEGAAVVSK